MRIGQPPWSRQRALEPAAPAIPLIEPSADEARNGWTAETLTAYVAGQRAAQSSAIRNSMEGRNRRQSRMQGGKRMIWSRTRRWSGNNCN